MSQVPLRQFSLAHSLEFSQGAPICNGVVHTRLSEPAGEATHVSPLAHSSRYEHASPFPCFAVHTWLKPWALDWKSQ